MSIDLNQFINKTIINAADLGVDQTSETIDIRQASLYAAHVVWTGGSSTAGNVIVEATNDDPNVVASPTYTQITSDAVSTTSGSLMKNNPGAGYSYVRVRWDQSAGTGGTITCKMSVKRN